jgi:hypothetical protein
MSMNEDQKPQSDDDIRVWFSIFQEANPTVMIEEALAKIYIFIYDLK